MTEEAKTPEIPEEAKPEEKPAEPAAGGPNLGRPLPWYRRFSWCLLISLLLAIGELALMTYIIFCMPGIVAYFLSGALLYGVMPFFFLLGAALCCNLAALGYWNRWTALVSALLYIQAGACLGITTVLTAIPAALCLVSMAWSVKHGR